MNKNLLLLFFLCLFSSNLFAQDISPSAEKRINLLTRVMAAELGLNESEYIRLKVLNQERIIKSDQIAEIYSHDPATQAKKILELETNFDKKIRAMLSPTQLATYAAYRHGPDNELALSNETKLVKQK